MTKEEIIKKEFHDIVDTFASNQALKSSCASKTLSGLTDELTRTAVDLMASTPEETYQNTINDYFKAIEEAAKLSPGFGTAIEDFTNEIYLTKYVGDIGDIAKTSVTEHTRFDLASITKLFTSLEAIKLHQDGLFNIYSVIDEIYLSPYRTLHITLLDAMRFKYELKTKSRIDEKGISLPEFYRRLLRPSIGPNKYVYSDIPYIIAKTLLPRTKEFFEEYYDELQYTTLGYNTDGSITGSEDLKGVSDGKARQMMNLGIEPGHAGLFGTIEDIIRVMDLLSTDFLNEESIKLLLDSGTEDFYAPFYDENNKLIKYRPINHGTGVYIEHPEGLDVGEVIGGLSSKAFSATGYTGGYSTFDITNGFATCYLSNPISIAFKEPYRLEHLIDEESLFVDKDGRIYPKDTKCTSEFINGQKVINVYKPDGSFYEKRTYTGMLNEFKLKQLYTVYKLRLIKRVSLQLAKSDNEVNEINKKFSNGKTFKKIR